MKNTDTGLKKGPAILQLKGYFMFRIIEFFKKRISFPVCAVLISLSIFYGNPLWAAAKEQEAPRLSDDEYIPAADWPEAPEISAEAAVLIEADSGTVLYAKNADSKRYPASITKILTALITIENCNLSDTLVFQGEALMPLPDGYVSIEPAEGEKMSVEDCLNGLLLLSANDAANALAVHNSGTIAAFARKMNERASQAGATHTHFSNPSGLADENHYTTAYDMAMIMRACIQHEDFLRIAGSLSYTIPATNTHAARYLEMRHQMLKPDSEFYYEYCRAGKTGFTSASGFTLVTYASRDGVNLISCVMQCREGEQYRSTRALFDYGFDCFQVMSREEADADRSTLTTDSFALNQIQLSPRFSLERVDSSPVILPKGLRMKDLETVIHDLNPEKEADGCFAEAAYMYEGMVLGSSRLRLTLNETADQPEQTISGALEKYEEVKPVIGACLAGIVLVLILALILAVRSLRRYRRNTETPDGEDARMPAAAGQNPEEKEASEGLTDSQEADHEKTEESEMNRIDFVHAKQVFEQYLDGYDREDEKIKLKITHTYCVVDCSREIAVRMGLSEEDVDLAMLIGLLHDIGRFEQVKRYNSFEPATMDHAMEGVHILFEEGMIRQFIEDDRFDDVIRTAIARHSDFELKGIQDERTLLHARLIRDADKLDNCRVKLEDSIEVLLNKTAEEAGKESISEQVFQSACERHSIYSPDRKTAMDYWVSYVAYIYDINFKETLQIIREKNYIHRIICRIPYGNEDTAEKMRRLESDIMAYLEEKTQS